ncbi:Uncharacterised protein [Segatella copri]|nr:Uncharacterised protein [Segatella copri]
MFTTAFEHLGIGQACVMMFLFHNIIVYYLIFCLCVIRNTFFVLSISIFPNLL